MNRLNRAESFCIDHSPKTYLEKNFELLVFYFQNKSFNNYANLVKNVKMTLYDDSFYPSNAELSIFKSLMRKKDSTFYDLDIIRKYVNDAYHCWDYSRLDVNEILADILSFFNKFPNQIFGNETLILKIFKILFQIVLEMKKDLTNNKMENKKLIRVIERIKNEGSKLKNEAKKRLTLVRHNIHKVFDQMEYFSRTLSSRRKAFQQEFRFLNNDKKLLKRCDMKCGINWKINNSKKLKISEDYFKRKSIKDNLYKERNYKKHHENVNLIKIQSFPSNLFKVKLKHQDRNKISSEMLKKFKIGMKISDEKIRELQNTPSENIGSKFRNHCLRVTLFCFDFIINF
jgi:hypothetical protein